MLTGPFWAAMRCVAGAEAVAAEAFTGLGLNIDGALNADADGGEGVVEGWPDGAGAGAGLDESNEVGVVRVVGVEVVVVGERVSHRPGGGQVADVLASVRRA